MDNQEQMRQQKSVIGENPRPLDSQNMMLLCMWDNHFNNTHDTHSTANQQCSHANTY